MKVSEIGLVLGVVAPLAVLSMFGSGWLVDRWFQRGRTDAHQRYFAIVGPITAALVCLAMLMSNVKGFVLIFVLVSCAIPSAGIASAGLQIVTPNELRGQVAALYLFVVNIIGISIGPMLPPFFSQYVVHDPRMVGWGIAATCVIVAPIGSMLLLWACRPAREAVARISA